MMFLHSENEITFKESVFNFVTDFILHAHFILGPNWNTTVAIDLKDPLCVEVQIQRKFKSKLLHIFYTAKNFKSLEHRFG